MLTALALAAAMLFPPLTVRVTAAPDVSRSLVARVVEEADAIWRPAGLCVSWRHADIDKDDIEPATVHVIIDDSAGPMLDVGLALGWTLVSDDGASAVIHVSYANAVAGLSYGGIDAAHLPKMSVDAIVAPALGRTLAHEIGHFLLATAEHSRWGLMHATWTADELFGIRRPEIILGAPQRAAIAATLSRVSPIARR